MNNNRRAKDVYEATEEQRLMIRYYEARRLGFVHTAAAIKTLIGHDIFRRNVDIVETRTEREVPISHLE